MRIVALDIGSVATKAVMWSDGDILAKSLTLTAWQPREAVDEALRALFEQCPDGEKPAALAATGYGRGLADAGGRLAEILNGPVLEFNEISALGRGLSSVDPASRLVLDVGGQDSKALKIDGQGRVLDFIMNDKCAAGAGVFVDSVRQSYNLSHEEFGRLAAQGTPVSLSSMCAVFAQTELVAQIARGVSRADLAAGVLASLATRLRTQCGRLFSREPVALTGGLSRLPVFAEYLSRSLEAPVTVPPDAPYLAALGAALMAAKKMERVEEKWSPKV